MSRLFRFATIGIIWILAIVCHWAGINFFAPGGQLWFLADPSTTTYVEDGWREGMYLVFAQRVPLIMIGGSLAWGIAKEYEDAVIGGYR